MKNPILKVLLVLIITLCSIHGYAQPSFNDPQNPLPSGKTWEKVDYLSSEFDTFEDDKLQKFSPTWIGRPPGLFQEENISVSGGTMNVVAKKLPEQVTVNGQNFTYGGGIVTSKNSIYHPEGTYFECRMKANKTFMSSTFWLKSLQTGDCGTKVFELDIQELVGKATTVPGNEAWKQTWTDHMMASTDDQTKCQEVTHLNYERIPLSSPGWEWHTYGCWVVNPDLVRFYLDGELVIEGPTDVTFDKEMFLRFAIETYNWNGPEPGNDGMDLPLADRTTQYDWVRSWKLVDDDGSDVPVTGVSVSPTSLSLEVAETSDLTETVSPSDATDKTVSWSSSNTTVATVNSSGLVTAQGTGSAIITVSTTDGNKTATCAVTVTTANVPVTGVTLSPTSATLTSAGATQALTATVSPSNATNDAINWTSNNTSVASVNTNGVVTAVANGNTTITATTSDGSYTATSIITVDIPVSGQTPYGGLARQIPGTIEVEEYDNGGEGVAYHDNDISNNGPDVFREDEAVDIEAKEDINIGWTAAGEWIEHTVNVTSGTYTIEARVATTAAGKSIDVILGSATLGTFTCPNTGNWSSFQTIEISGVTIDGGNGQILRTEFTTGGVNINWIKFTAVSTNVPVTGVSVAPTSLSIDEGSTGNLTATVNPSNATDASVSWNSSNTSVATVNSSGVITAVSAGTATVTVSTTDGGYTATSTITVIGGGTEPTSVTLSPIHDAYLQGTTRYNNTLLRIEAGRRVGYLMYDLSGINGTITAASLKLTCNGDAGNGNIDINLGNGTGWTETTLSSSNAPSAVTLLGNFNSSYSTGSSYTATLSAGSISGGGDVSIILTQTGGNDVAFASKENSATEPQLLITYDAPKSAEESIVGTNKLNVKVYPNPVNGDLFAISFTNSKSERVSIKIFNVHGQLVYGTSTTQEHIEIDTDSLFSKGVFIIAIQGANMNHVERLIVR